MPQQRNSVYDEAYQLYIGGLSLKGVGKKIGRTRQSVFKAFQLRGFEMRQVISQPFQIYDGKKFTLRPSGYYSLTTQKRKSMHRYVWEKERGPIPPNHDIHHADEDKSNNDISNLECLPKAEHTRKYSPHHNQYTHNKKSCG